MKIDPEFHALIPPLSTDEYAQLEENIKKDGCREPLVVWDDILLDGHNRHEICTRLGLSYKTVSIELQDRDAAKSWIDSNQLGRRNLTPDQMSLIRGRLYNRTKQQHGGQIPGIRMGQNEPSSTAESLSSKFGVSPATVKRDGAMATYLAENPEEEKAVLTGKKKLADVRRERKKEERLAKISQLKDNPPKQTAKPSLVLADPPWKYNFSETESREIENQYPTLTVQDIIKQSPDTEKDCLLFLWATAPKLREALEVVAGWGFEYKTHAVWDKEIIGMGYWFRGRHEILMVATKGKVSPPSESLRISSIFTERRRNHSQKPECVYQWIESTFPGMIKLEMYCRNPRPGWNAVGDEIS
jgi:N6-adenosine-specific RNA methylase IME4